jgi:predicted enzyme related to lactoylglutathione lyase
MPITKSRLSTGTVSAVLASRDSERARDFYERVLGLETEQMAGAPGYFMVLAGNGTRFLVYPTEAPMGGNTVAGFLVDDLEPIVQELRDRGLTFEEYDMPGMKTVNGIADMGSMGRSAWFRDSEGNILSIAQM